MNGSACIHDHEGIRFSVGDTRFRVLLGDSKDRTTTDEEIVILKPVQFLKLYDAILGSLPNNNVVEVGIAEGGSIIYFALAFPHLRFVGIDLRSPNPAVLRHLDRLGLADRVTLYYGINQNESRRINEVIADNFGDEPLGAVIDDASHFYAPSRRTFENAFLRLAPGGVYCVEDWTWAHDDFYQGDHWQDQPALSNLIFEWLMLLPSTKTLIKSININYNIATAVRGSGVAAKIDLDADIKSRGRRLVLI